MAVRSAIPGLVVAKFLFTSGSVPWLTTMHGRTADGTANTAAKMQGLATALDAILVAQIAALVNTQQTYLGVAVADLSPALLPDEVNASAVVGTRGGSAEPTSSPVVVTYRTGSVGRAFRGRGYWSGAITGDLAAGATEWTPAYAAAMGTLATNLIAAFPIAAPTAYTPVIYHRAAGQGGVPAADSTTPILTALGRTEVAVQRSRRA